MERGSISLNIADVLPSKDEAAMLDGIASLAKTILNFNLILGS
jgi:hypothetical protein